MLENVLRARLNDGQMRAFYGGYLKTVGGVADCTAITLRRDLICGVPF